MLLPSHPCPELTHRASVCALSLSHAHALPHPWGPGPQLSRVRSLDSCSGRITTDFCLQSSPALNKPHPCKPLPIFGPVATPLGGSGSLSWDPAHLWGGVIRHVHVLGSLGGHSRPAWTLGWQYIRFHLFCLRQHDPGCQEGLTSETTRPDPFPEV